MTLFVRHGARATTRWLSAVFTRSVPRTLAAWGVVAALACATRAIGAQKVSPVRPGTRPAGTGVGAAGASGAALSAAERSALVRVIAAEDARPRDDAGTAPILTALDDKSPTVRRVAVRALGRLQRPTLLDPITPSLADADPRVRLEAANAIAQTLQGLRGADATADQRRAAIDNAVDALVRTAERFPDPAFLGAAARTLGRLPYADSVVPREVERVIVEMGERPGVGGRPLVRGDARVAQGIMHGLYSLARARRQTGGTSPRALAAMRWATTFGLDSARPGGGATTATVQEAAARVRRLAVVASQALRDTAVRRAVVTASLRDPSFVVRFEAVRAYRTLPAPRPCAPLIAMTYDPNPHVLLAAIDALGTGCDERQLAADTLLGVIDMRNTQRAIRPKGGTSWHPHAHALVALARVAPATAIPLLRRDARHPLWQVRLYVARAAAAVKDTLTLSALAYDTNGNVREAALAGISSTVGHVADRVFTAALASTDYQVVLQAATALKGAPFPDSVVPALLAAFDRLSAEQRENALDPRLAILDRLGELGGPRQASRLAAYAADFDSTVARRAATILERWTLRRVAATPRPLPRPGEQVASLLGGELRLLVKMSSASGGGSFVVRLLTDEAPVTVARLVRLARSGYYAGLTFHRVEPTFVIQGGSPAATEYVGDGPFMRDEVGLPSHVRGTLGISTRGRDTGDAQLFVNLTDNFRLDHDYTVFGEIIQGREVAEGIIEGDVIERVDVVRAR